VPRTADPTRASRCHLRDPQGIFDTEVQPRLP
jgi:peptide/nickel transport system ATP-binding protein